MTEQIPNQITYQSIINDLNDFFNQIWKKHPGKNKYHETITKSNFIKYFIDQEDKAALNKINYRVSSSGQYGNELKVNEACMLILYIRTGELPSSSWNRYQNNLQMLYNEISKARERFKQLHSD